MPLLRILAGSVLSTMLATAALLASPAGEEVSKIIDAYDSARKEGADRPDETVRALEKVIDANPTDPAVLDALAWMFRFGRQSSGSDFPLDATFFKRLEDHHLEDPRLKEIIIALYGYHSEELQSFLKVTSEKSGVEEVRGFALYSLAGTYEFDDDATEQFEAALAELVEKHESLTYNGRDLMPRARSQLFAARNLAVGKEAPEIIGTDVAGAALKLTAFRGRITYIVFWGDW